MKKLIAVLFSAFAASAFAGNTYYADASVEVSGDGLTPETAKKTIQEAVDLCTGNGHTVMVAEGLYNEGVATNDTIKARVYIKYRTNLIASGRKEKTIITGEFDKTSDTGIGSEAVRGVYFYYTGSGTAGKRTAGSIIKGFTICNAATETGGSGGGLYLWMSYGADCIVSNCVAKRAGGIYQGTVARFLVADCASGGSSEYGTASQGTTYLNSIIARQRGSATTFYANCTLYNCTIAGNNGSYFTYSGTPKLINSIYTDNANQAFHSSYKGVVSNSVIATGTTYVNTQSDNVHYSTTAYGFAAPAIGDWRPSAEMGAANVGDAELLKLFDLPDDLEDQRYLDYYGNVIPKSGTIICGAVQEISTATSLVTFSGSAHDG